MSTTITRKQTLNLLETVQEFINTNPNEVGALPDSALLTENLYRDLGQTITRQQILNLLETVQEFVNTNPNEASTLPDSTILTKALYTDLDQTEDSIGELKAPSAEAAA